jgi:archaellum component FlaC
MDEKQINRLLNALEGIQRELSQINESLDRLDCNIDECIIKQTDSGRGLRVWGSIYTY